VPVVPSVAQVFAADTGHALAEPLEPLRGLLYLGDLGVVDRNQASDRLTVAGNGDLLAAFDAVEELGEVGLGFKGADRGARPDRRYGWEWAEPRRLSGTRTIFRTPQNIR
jgi:hypothetical protein